MINIFRVDIRYSFGRAFDISTNTISIMIALGGYRANAFPERKEGDYILTKMITFSTYQQDTYTPNVELVI